MERELAAQTPLEEALEGLSLDLYLPDGSELYATGLKLPPGVSFEDWQRCVSDLEDRLVRAALEGQVCLMALGDALEYGERAYGEKYAQAVEQTGKPYGSLANVAWVARNVPLPVRRPELTFSHHQAVAPLDDAKAQKCWLDKAVKEEWSYRELRAAMQEDEDRGNGLDPAAARAGRALDRALAALTEDGVAEGDWAALVVERLLEPLVKKRWQLRHIVLGLLEEV